MAKKQAERAVEEDPANSLRRGSEDLKDIPQQKEPQAPGKLLREYRERLVAKFPNADGTFETLR